MANEVTPQKWSTSWPFAAWTLCGMLCDLAHAIHDTAVAECTPGVDATELRKKREFQLRLFFYVLMGRHPTDEEYGRIIQDG